MSNKYVELGSHPIYNRIYVILKMKVCICLICVLTNGKPTALTYTGVCLTTETSSSLSITSQVIIYEKRLFTVTCRDAGHTAKSLTFSGSTKQIVKLLYILKSRCAASQ